MLQSAVGAHPRPGRRFRCQYGLLVRDCINGLITTGTLSFTITVFLNKFDLPFADNTGKINPF